MKSLFVLPALLGLPELQLSYGHCGGWPGLRPHQAAPQDLGGCVQTTCGAVQDDGWGFGVEGEIRSVRAPLGGYRMVQSCVQMDIDG